MRNPICSKHPDIANSICSKYPDIASLSPTYNATQAGCPYSLLLSSLAGICGRAIRKRSVGPGPTDSSGIVAHLVYSSAANGTYRLPPKDGFFPKEGLYTKTYWTIDNPGASSELRIDGTQVSAPSKSFHDMGSAIMTYEPTPLPANRHQYTSYIRAPSAGCWRLQITSGGASGSIVMWVVE
jgi:hypothetical protein